MTSKDKESKSFQDKLKQIFKVNKANMGNFKTREFELNDDIKRELTPDAPLQTRMKAIKLLNEVVLTNKLEDRAIERIWSWLKDLLENDKPTETRHLTFQFFQNLVEGQKDRLALIRAHFFRVIKQHNNAEDLIPRFELLKSLTDNGKDICYFEEAVGPFLLDWLPDISAAGKSEEYLEMLVRVVKFNAAYLEDNIITGLIHHICVLSCTTPTKEVIMSCLEVLDTIVAYSNLPSDSLPEFVGVLCRTVNGETFCHLSWKIMRNLLGTHMGHSALFTMCRILQEPCLRDDAGLLRGAIFYIKMALWGNQNLSNLNCPPSVVLHSILQCIKCNHPIVIYEVILALQSLINKHGAQLHDPAWNNLLNILCIIIRYIEADTKKTSTTTVSKHLHDTLNSIEIFIERGTYNGSIKQFYDIIEECSTTRPEISILKLISYLSQDIIPIRHMWLTSLNNLLNRYYKNETRTNIRLKVLDVLFNTVKIHRRQYGDELLDKIVIPHLLNVYNDPNTLVRTESAKLLIDMCINCETKRCLDILDILEKILNRPFTVNVDGIQWYDSDVSDVKEVVSGLIETFAIKIHGLPSIHAIRIFKMFIKHLELHYEKPKILEHCNSIRCRIFEYFLKIRADTNYHLGCPDLNAKLKFSTYLAVTYKNVERGPLASPPPVSPAVTQQPNCTVTYMSMIHAFRIVITCLQKEKDWKVLSLVLQELPKALQNKTLILSKHENNEVGILVNRLCGMIAEKTLPDMKITKSDFHAAILPVLSSLASYHAYLETSHQQQMIRCLYKFCIGPRSSRHCINALTTCTLEMSEVMVKMLPDVLLTLSKISATVHIAIPILEFLSTITILPTIYASFVGDQYMAIFAISLPYTNPFKYNHYTVSLAHHVIAVWFLKCRLPLRKDFVRFIMNGLQTNALIPFEETNTLKVDLSKLNQDSSDRKRSSSLTEQTSRSRERTSTIAGRMDKPKFDFKPAPDKALHTFYEELMETCIDLMARYTYSPCSALPRRLPTAEFLLNGGQSMSWLLGNKVVTVTTSGCAQKALKQGLCDKCYNACKSEQGKTSDDHQKLSKGNSGERDKEDLSNRVTRQNSGEKSNTSASSPLEENKRLTDKLDMLPSKLQQLSNLENTKREKQLCACWCQSWAEIYIRRPTGDMSWVMRIQNQISTQQAMYDFPLKEITKLFASPSQSSNEEYESEENPTYQMESEPHKEEEEMSTSSNPISIPGSPNKYSTSRQSSRDSIDDEAENISDDKGKSRNPVRRSNSSPEMSANWKNPFLSQKQDNDNSDSNKEEDICKKKNYSKDMRVSCEAIPEEIAGMSTTPPNNEEIQSKLPQGIGGQVHPSLLSCHSYPGSSPPQTSSTSTKLYQTVPASPNNLITTSPPLLLANYPNRSSLTSMKSKSLSTESNSSDKSTNERPSNLPANLVPLRTKPPQSPTQTSPRFTRHNILARDRDGHEIQKSSSLILEKPTAIKGDSNKERKNTTFERSSSLFDTSSNSQRRDRGYTISVMSPVRKPATRHSGGPQATNTRTKDTPKSGINPSFVFLQLYHMAQFGSANERPLLVDSNEVVQRALKVLDCIPPYETHKIGVIYIGNGQCNNESEILRNKFGSVRYIDFLHKLGTLIKLQDVDPQVCFLGGLEQNGADGKFSYIWQDDIIRVMFHVATLMPNKDTDPNCTNKKLHIGNNNVTIVYNESGEEYNINTIKGQFNFASIIVQPLDHNTNKVTVKAKPELADLICNSEPNTVSDKNVSVLARQLAIHANLASLVFNSLKSTSKDPYASNWLERLRKIKNLRNKIIQESKKENTNQMDDNFVKSRKGQMEDFTEYT